MRIPLHTRILAGAVIGAAAGGFLNLYWGDEYWLGWTVRNISGPIGQVFLRLLFMFVVPLMFAALVLGISGLGDLRQLGRIGAKTLLYTIAVSGIAVAIGLALVNMARPGDGVAPEVRQRLQEQAQERFTGSPIATEAPSAGIDLLVRIVPANPIKAAADGDYLAWMFFASAIGIGLCLVPAARTASFRATIEGLFEICMAMIGVVIRLAPIGVMALLFSLTAQFGWDLLIQLARYVAVVIAALAIHQFVVYSLAVRVLGGMNPVTFFRGVQEAMLTAFSTASSNATLPTALRVAEEKLHLPPHVSRFVLTIGATANQNGTALFEGVTVLFLAQFYGIELGLSQQVIVIVMCILGGIGTAGVPAGSLPVVAIIMSMVGVPVEGIGLILGVDRLLDMCRTTLNVTGDLAAAVVISRSER